MRASVSSNVSTDVSVKLGEEGELLSCAVGVDLFGRATASDGKCHAEPGPEGSHVVLENNMQAAIEVKVGEELKVLYPNRCHTFTTSTCDVMKVSLRDDPTISGTCQVGDSRTLSVSESFGPFGVDAAHFLQKEQEEVRQEQCLCLKRKQRTEKKLRKERWENVYCWFPLFFSCTLLSFGFLTLCVFLEPQDVASAIVLSLTAAMLLGCVVVNGCLIQQFGTSFSRNLYKWLAYHGAFGFCFLAILAVVVAVARYALAGFWWSGLLAGLPCCGLSTVVCFAWSTRSLEEEVQDMQVADREVVAERTIVFKGKVRPGLNCICSWPGKYESAWDALVTGSRKGNLSAAVVFLPEGSEHFGTHDPIPQEEDLPGTCWCIPLYGEQKPWGCTWWTKWMRNIEQAVEQGAELEVYFFAGMKGKGKVESFLTAGKESLRREAILCKKKEFLKSQDFLDACQAGIEGLPKELGGGSSSQYSREIQRLFLAWLSEEDSSFIEASEGLGNSQKAEVAWLDRKGYAYTEVEVDVSTWTSIQGACEKDH